MPEYYCDDCKVIYVGPNFGDTAITFCPLHAMAEGIYDELETLYATLLLISRQNFPASTYLQEILDHALATLYKAKP